MDRLYYWIGSRVYEEMGQRDDALHTVMYGSSAANLDVIKRVIVNVLDPLVADRQENAVYFLERGLVRYLNSADERRVNVWRSESAELRGKHDVDRARLAATSQWFAIFSAANWAILRDVVKNFGPGPLYLADALLTGQAFRLLNRR